MAEMRLKIADVREWTNTIFDAMERAGVDTLPIDQDHYWSIWPTDSFELDKLPEHMVGALSDDIADLNGDMAVLRSGDSMNLWHTLGHLAGVINFMAAANDPTQPAKAEAV